MNLANIVVPPPSRQGLRFKDLAFNEPISLESWLSSNWMPGPAPALYGIVVLDSDWSPRPYRPIYFGESGDVFRRVTTSHEKYSAWISEAGTLRNLYVVEYYMPFSTTDERRVLEGLLIAHYNPICNKNQPATRYLALLGRARSTGERSSTLLGFAAARPRSPSSSAYLGARRYRASW